MIKTSGLSKTFPGGVDAVRGLDLAVEAGEIVGFLGPNGAGNPVTALGRNLSLGHVTGRQADGAHGRLHEDQQR